MVSKCILQPHLQLLPLGFFESLCPIAASCGVIISNLLSSGPHEHCHVTFFLPCKDSIAQIELTRLLAFTWKQPGNSNNKNNRKKVVHEQNLDNGRT